MSRRRLAMYIVLSYRYYSLPFLVTIVLHLLIAFTRFYHGSALSEYFLGVSRKALHSLAIERDESCPVLTL